MSTIYLNNNNFIKAEYGSKEIKKDITNIIQKLINKNKVFSVNNKTFGRDPHPGKKKKLYVETEKRNFEISENNMAYFYLEDNLITLDCINELDALSQYKKIRVFGKGPTFKNVAKTNQDQLHICINQTANMVDDCDILSMNDIHNIGKINKDVIRKIKFILIPEYLHVKCVFDPKGYWINLHNSIKDDFKGKYILFNLFSNLNKNPSLFPMKIGTSSVNTATHFICNNLKGIKKIEFYGAGIESKKNYHKIFTGNGNYTSNDRIKFVRKYIKRSCEEAKISYQIN